MLGVPDERVGPTHLTFEPDARALVLACGVRVGEHVFPQLYVRYQEDEKYHAVSELIRPAIAIASAETLCIGSWLIGGGKLYCSLLGMAPAVGRLASGRELGLASVDMLARSTEVDVWHPSLTITGVVGVSELIGYSNSGVVYAVVGFAFGLGTVGHGVDYHVSKIDWARRSVDRLFPLPNIFF